MKLSRQFSKALAFTSGIHRGHHRKGSTIPYMAHLMAVSSLVLEHGGSETESIAALLHDAIEDRGDHFRLGPAGMRNQIRKRFGEYVLFIVDECSETDEDPKPPWRERKEEYIRKISAISTSGLLVSLADKVHNAHSILSDYQQIGDELWRRFNGGKQGSIWYYKELLAAFRERNDSPPALLAELGKELSELEEAMPNN